MTQSFLQCNSPTSPTASTEMATASYDRRKKERKDYKQLSDLQLPRLRAKQDDKLYDLDIVEEDMLTQRVKVHYIGYGSEDDE